jgi:hypothetical protein
MSDSLALVQNLDDDPGYIAFKQDPNTGLLSRMRDIMDKKNMPIEEYREIEKKKTAEMKADYLRSNGQQSEAVTAKSLRFGRSGRISAHSSV